ncbi:MAG: HAMP domain-containing histidine kinase [Deltaproteobacteria bacterium]|nr:HAMP domain-containing histidine kinase [Deltaproteobacteria bacterium]
MSFVDTSLESLNWQIAFMRQELDHLRTMQKELRSQARVCFENSAKLEAIIRAFDGFIYVCSANHEIEYMNDRMIKSVGQKPTSGEKCFKILHGLDHVCDWCVNERVFKGETVSWEIRSPKDNHYYHIVNTPIYYPDGSMAKMAMIRDITDQKVGEIERERLITQLETRNSDLEVLSYAISHDLRSPIITIKGLLKWIERDTKSGNLERLNKSVTTVVHLAARMEELVSDMLKLFRIATIKDERSELSLQDIVCEAVELLAGKIAQNNVSVTIQDNLPNIFACRNKLLTIMQNLIENASKYMGQQTDPKIEIGSARDGDELIIFVQDNGMGIEPRNQEKIFRLFVKLDEKSDGTGIGLAMLKRIVESENGRIWVESEGLGHGSRFCFTLPLGDTSITG